MNKVLVDKETQLMSLELLLHLKLQSLLHLHPQLVQLVVKGHQVSRILRFFTYVVVCI